MKYVWLLALIWLLAAACGDDDGSSASTATPQGSCADYESSVVDACWVQVLPPGNGGFMPYPGSGDEPKWQPGKYPMTLNPVIAFNGDLWMVSSLKMAFSSSDAVHWTQHDKNETPNRLASTVTFFKGRLWIMGGSDLYTQNFSNEIWSSKDGSTWEKAGNGAWPGRDSTTLVEFQGKLWLFGGANHRDQKLGTDSFLNDVWSSEDGISWTQVTAAAPWAPRSYPRIAIFNDEMYLLGGESHADVWKSSNGKDWTQLTTEAPWGDGGRQAYGALAFGGGLWVFGGFVGDSKNGVNDIWYSEDGVTWERQTEHAPWTRRDPIAIVYKDKLWLYAGKYTGSKDSWNGDLWTMTVSG
jgi:hypothetical protein